jgi:hypothetical protein
MRYKPISQFLFLLGLLIILVLSISDVPGEGLLRTVGYIFSILVIAASLLLDRFWKGQQAALYDLVSRLKDRVNLINWMMPIIVFLWPLIIFWQLILPSGFNKAIGNDFIHWYYSYKVYLMSNLRLLQIPHWSPAEAAGFPFSASPLTQTYYPLNLPYAVYAYFKGGITILSYQTFTILGISIFSLGLYFWLKSLKGNNYLILLVCLIIPVSYKLIETARFPNAVHTAAWYPWILLGLTRLFQIKSVKAAIGWTAFLSFVGFNLISAGYPYFVYYLIFLVPFYGLLLAIPKFRVQLLRNQTTPRWRLILASITTTGTLLLILLLPYLKQMSDLLVQTTNRIDQNQAWASGAFSATPRDFIGSVIFPPAAITEGWFYFGIFSLVLIIFFLIASFTKPQFPPGHLFTQGLALVFLVWIVLIIYLGWDNNSSPWNIPWMLLWKYLPGFNRLRVWARINILLLPVIALLLVRALGYFYNMLDDRKLLQSSRRAIIFSGGISIGILFFQIFNNNPEKFSRYWDWMETGSPINYIILAGISILLFFSTIWIASQDYFRTTSKLPLAVFLSLFLIFDSRGGQISPWIWIQEGKTSYLTKTHSARIIESGQIQLPDSRVEKTIPIPLNGDFNVEANRISWHFQRYVEFLDQTDHQEIDRQILLGQEGGQLFFFTRNIDYQDIKSLLDDHQVTNEQVSSKVIKYSGDEVILEINTNQDIYLSYIDNWDPNWRAYLNGEEISITLLFGTFKSVALPAGNHQVKFVYQP